jgi:hypothetical protein
LNNNVASVNADSDAYAGIKPRNRIMHLQRGQARSHRMIFMRLGCTKECHYPVTLNLVYNSLEAVDRLFHQGKQRIKSTHRELGIPQTVNKAGRISNVSKENRQPLVFSPGGSESV